jgi:DNA invertase Pin-like site-specific DNA recombinase
MLLSFARFEREIAGERIRDKIAVSKAKGMWMGGNVPLGYDVKERKLVINEAEASTGYDDAQVIEIVLHVALNTWTNYFNEVAKTDIDFPAVTARHAA